MLIVIEDTQFRFENEDNCLVMFIRDFVKKLQQYRLTPFATFEVVGNDCAVY